MEIDKKWLENFTKTVASMGFTNADEIAKTSGPGSNCRWHYSSEEKVPNSYFNAEATIIFMFQINEPFGNFDRVFARLVYGQQNVSVLRAYFVEPEEPLPQKKDIINDILNNEFEKCQNLDRARDLAKRIRYEKIMHERKQMRREH